MGNILKINIPRTKMNEEDKSLFLIYDQVINKLTKENHLWQKGIMLFANRHAQVINVYSTDSVPDNFMTNKDECLDFSNRAIGNNSIGDAAISKKPCMVIDETNEALISLPIYSIGNEVFGIISLFTNVEYKEEAKKYLKNIAHFFEIIIEDKYKIEKLEKEKQRRDALFTISQSLYSTFDVNEVLIEAVNNIYLFYPNDKIEFFMTHDNFIPNVPVKQFTFIPNNEDINSRAFLEGKLIMNKRKDSNNGEMAIPLKGKQGVYGVIHLLCEEKCEDSEDKVSFISNIADIISNAFENAKLYQQSISSVKELQIINELTKRLNQSLDIKSILQFVISESLKMFNGQAVIVSQVDITSETLKVVASNLNDIIGASVNVEYGYLGMVYKRKDPIIISDIMNDKKMEDKLINDLGYSSLISVPILVNKEIMGILTVLSDESSHFSFKDFRMLQLFAQHIGFSLSNAFLHEKIHHMAITDYLTGLYNRSYLDNQLESSRINDDRGSVLLYDIDDFKKVNDTYGHQIGDEVLKQISTIIKASIRAEDIASRWGGEEIAVYLPRVNENNAQLIANRILKRIVNETKPKVTVSCGVASWRKENIDDSNLTFIRKADKALYEAKNMGKNRVNIYND